MCMCVFPLKFVCNDYKRYFYAFTVFMCLRISVVCRMEMFLVDRNVLIKFLIKAHKMPYCCRNLKRFKVDWQINIVKCSLSYSIDTFDKINCGFSSFHLMFQTYWIQHQLINCGYRFSWHFTIAIICRIHDTVYILSNNFVKIKLATVSLFTICVYVSLSVFSLTHFFRSHKYHMTNVVEKSAIHCE